MRNWILCSTENAPAEISVYFSLRYAARLVLPDLPDTAASRFA